MLTITPIRALQDNYIWMITNNTDKAWIVDPGEAQPVIDALKEKNLTLAGILVTHHHGDHSAGIPDLLDYAGNVPVYAGHKSALTTVTHRVKNGDKVDVLSTPFAAIEIPGHTLDHTAYYGDNILFSGDTLFSVGCGRVFEGTPEQMHASLQTLAHLSDETKIYCGHEYTQSNLKFAEHVDADNHDIKKKIAAIEKQLQINSCTLPSELREEKLVNPFLRCDDPNILRAVELYSGKTLKNPTEVFQYLREWKNNFK
jgi:hydroxyacylglutathione hydrolase